MAGKKFSVFMAEAYPDSIRSDWWDMLRDQFVCAARSPLHEFDTDDDGAIKKPHWHVVISYDGPRNIDNVREFWKSLHQEGKTAPLVLPCHNKSKAVQYFIHKNNPEKYQYPRQNIEQVNGFDVERCFLLSTEEDRTISIEIINDIEEHKITEYRDLLLYYKNVSNDKITDKFDYARKHTIFFSTYLSSFRNSKNIR